MLTVERMPGVTGGMPYEINGRYSMRIFSGDEYLEHLGENLERAINFDVGRFHSNPTLAEKMMARNMLLEDKQMTIVPGKADHREEIPSITFFNKRVGNKEYLAGLAQQRIYLIHTVAEGLVPLLYIAFRVLDEEDRGLVNLHLGRKAVQQARVIHGGVRWLAHRTGHEVPAYSFAQATKWAGNRLYPWKDTFDSVDPITGTLVQRELKNALWHHVRINATGIDDFGIAHDEYDEVSEANVTRPGHPELDKFHHQMEENGFVFGSRDAQYALGKAA